MSLKKCVRMENKKKRLAVVLFNLGGPDNPQAIRPFLYNLFYDPAIIPWPNPFRRMLAWGISRGRSKKAEKIYEILGGRSPIYENTQIQAKALKETLTYRFPEYESEVFIAMRYWHPFSHETKKEVQDFEPDRVLLLPLYPQFSGTTTGSSFNDWSKDWPEETINIGCYFDQKDFIEAYCNLIFEECKKVPSRQPIRFLFSAHGLPKRNILKGDPYQWQVEQTVQKVVIFLKENFAIEIDHVLCYQSKVGKLEWIGPSLSDEIERAALDGVGVVVVPISFVSEHSETLVELDVEYAKKSKALGIPYYGRVSTVMDHDKFIYGLGSLVGEKLSGDVNQSNSLMCPKEFTQCGCRMKEG